MFVTNSLVFNSLRRGSKWWHGLCNRGWSSTGINPMKTQTYSAQGFESTYAMIVRSEEKERSLFEGLVYFAVVLSALITLWHAATQAVPLPLRTVHTSSISQSAKTIQRA